MPLFAPVKKPGEGEEKKKSKGLDIQFSSKVDQGSNIINRRIAILEDRYNNMRKQMQFADQTILENRHDINKKIKLMDDELEKLDSEIKDLIEKIDELSSEIAGSAKADDLKTIEKYIDLWRPVQFVTREEAKKLLGK